MKSLLHLLAIFSIILAFPSPVLSGPIVDEATKAENLANEGKDREAIFAMDLAIAKLWEKLGLTIVEANFTDGKAKSYGNYDVHPTATYKAGDDMYVYVETIGYRYGGGDGEFYISMTADLEIKTADGKAVAKKEAFTKLAYKSKLPNREFMITITYNFTGIPQGKYIVTTKLNDDNFNHWASFDLPFTIE